MLFQVFHQAEQRLCFGERGTKGAFGHQFGGGAEYTGLQAFAGQPPVHVLFRLNTADPLVGVKLETTQYLPLLCAIRYGGCRLGYQVLADSEVKILCQDEKRAWKDFPSKKFPSTLPARPVSIFEVSCDRDCPDEVYFRAGVFGFDELTPQQFQAVVQYVVQNGFYDSDINEESSAEEYLRAGVSHPFLQATPDDPCPNPKCRRRRMRSALRPFAVFQEDDARNLKKLWDGADVQVIYQICPECQSILATNQCS